MVIAICSALLIIFLIYLFLPLPVMRFLASKSRNQALVKLAIVIIAGILMALYARLGAFLLLRFSVLDGDLLSYTYDAEQFKMIVPIMGAIGGVFLQAGAALATRIEKAVFACGVFVWLGLALLAAIMVITPG